MQSEQGIGNNLPLQAVVWTVLLLNLLHFLANSNTSVLLYKKISRTTHQAEKKEKRKKAGSRT